MFLSFDYTASLVALIFKGLHHIFSYWQGMTEMQTFISNCNDTLASIAELVYDDVTPMLDTLFEENITVYINMESLLSNTSQQTPQVTTQYISYRLFGPHLM